MSKSICIIFTYIYMYVYISLVLNSASKCCMNLISCYQSYPLTRELGIHWRKRKHQQKHDSLNSSQIFLIFHFSFALEKDVCFVNINSLALIAHLCFTFQMEEFYTQLNSFFFFWLSHLWGGNPCFSKKPHV